MFCVRCGNQIYPGQKFCPKCGYPVENHPDPPRKEMDFRENGTADTYSPYERETAGASPNGYAAQSSAVPPENYGNYGGNYGDGYGRALEAATGIATEEALEAATGIAMGEVMFMEWQVREQKPPTGL